MKVLHAFIDKFDRHEYAVGDEFPHDDSVVAEFKPERIEQLVNAGFIAEEVPTEAQVDTVTEPTEFPKHLGGGNYELSDGSNVKGKQAAIDAEAALKAGE